MKDHLSDRTAPDPIDRDSVADSWGRTAAYDAYADGLHTYALGGLRNHEAAAAAVYCTFVAADHHVAHLGDAEMLRPWLYAITRYYCRLGGLPRMRLTSAPRRAGGEREADSAMAGLERNLLQAELSSLDWPDTDGLVSAHREVLELSVRHGLESKAVGLMLSRPAAESFELLSAAWHELERSLAAMALLRTTREHCADLARLARGWSGRLTMQQREPLVAHVDGCSRCQYYLHKVVGTPQAPTILPHVAAPKTLRARVLGDLVAAGPEVEAEKAAIAGRLVRFDRFGFPVAATVLVAPGPMVVAPEVARRGARAAVGGSDRAAVAGARGRGSVRGGLARREPVIGAAHIEAEAGGVRAGAGGKAGESEARKLSGSRQAGDGNGVNDSVGGKVGAWNQSADARHQAGDSEARNVSGSRRATDRSDANDSASSKAGPSASGRADARSRLSGSAGDSAAAPVRIGGSAAGAGRAGGGSTARVLRSAGSADGGRHQHGKSRRLRSALTSSAVLGGVAAAGGTAFVLLIPTSPATKPLLTQEPGSPGGIVQAPDLPMPTSAASVVPVAGRPVRSGGGLVGDRGQSSVILQAVVVPIPPASDSVFVTTPAPPPGPPTLPSLPPPTSAGGQGVLNVAVNQRSNNPDELTVTLWNSGTAPVSWTAAADASYLTLDKTSGTLAPGTQQSVQITVDQATVPQGPWQAHVRFDPGGQSVTLSGGTIPTPPPSTSPSTTPSTSRSSSPSGTPSTSPSTTPTGTPSPPPTTAPTSVSSSTSVPPSTVPPSSPSQTSTTSATPPPTSPPATPPTAKPSPSTTPSATATASSHH